MNRAPIGITMGDPAGVGPELIAQLLQRIPPEACVIYGSRAILERAGIPSNVSVQEVPFSDVESFQPSQVRASYGRVAEVAIRLAASDALAGRIRAMVTAPICKEALHLAGCSLTAHTEILEDCCGNRVSPSMIFWSPTLTVGLVTTHIPIAEVPRAITPERILSTIRRTAKVCEATNPRLAVLSLNPHIGEGGLMGREEEEVIMPAIELARAEGYQITQLLAPDTAFAHQPYPFDGVIAMYHDQGLIPFKMVAFNSGVNVTMGLPIVRTSPDHGTAFDIAWQGIAQVDSLLAAYNLADRLSR